MPTLKEIKAGAVFNLIGSVNAFRFVQEDFTLEVWNSQWGFFWYADVIYFGEHSIKISRVGIDEDINHKDIRDWNGNC